MVTVTARASTSVAARLAALVAAVTVERRWAEIVDMVGEPTARVWRLYLVGGGLTFAEGRMGVDQILAVRPSADGSSGMPTMRHVDAGGRRA